MEIFQVLEESTDSDVKIFLSEEDEDGTEPDSDEDGQFLGKMASYLFRQFFQRHKSYENAIGTRNVVAVQGQIKKIGQQNLGNKSLEIEKGQVQENADEEVTAVALSYA
jgi:hypothetical protein